MLQLLRRASASEFVRNVRRLVVGNVLSQIIALLSMLIVARLFDPEEFGVAALFMSITMMSSSIGSLRYDQAIVLPKSDFIAIRLLELSILVAIACSVLLLFMVIIIELVVPEFVWVRQLGVWFYAFPLGTLLMAIFYAFSAWRMRQKHFSRLAFAPVVLSTVTAGGRIGFGYWWGSSVAGLILGSLMGVVAQFYVVAAGASVMLRGDKEVNSQSHSRLLKLMREYREFPLYAAPATLVKQLGENMPVLLLSLMFAPAVVGFYAVANRLVRLPVGMVSESMRKVYLQRASQLMNSGVALRSDLIKVTILMLTIGAIPTAFLVIAAPWLFTVFLGDQWVVAGEFTVILAPWLLAIFAAAPASTIYIVLRRQSLWLRMQAGRTTMMGVALYLPYLFGHDATGCLVVLAVVGSIANVSIIITALGLCSNHDRNNMLISREAAG